MEVDSRQGRKPGRSWVTPVIVAIIGAVATVAAAYVGNRGGFTEILPGNPVKVVTVTKTVTAAPPGSGQAAQAAAKGGSFRNTYLYTLTPVENDYDAPISSGPVVMSNQTYQNSVSIQCYGEAQNAPVEIAYDVDGASFLNATVGIPDDAQNAAGDTLTITFFKNGPSSQLAAPINVSVGQPQNIHLNLDGASQLDFTCAAVNDTTQQGTTLDFALGGAQLTGS